LRARAELCGQAQARSEKRDAGLLARGRDKPVRTAS
jgi:hypothetical protein